MADWKYGEMGVYIDYKLDFDITAVFGHGRPYTTTSGDK